MLKPDRMTNSFLLIVATVLLISTTGCRNRCDPGFRNGWFASSPTIPAPPTYSLNIPSVAKNQPYYVPGGGNRTANGSLNTSPAPTPSAAGGSGWRPVDGNTTNNSNPGSTGGSVLSAPTTFVDNRNPANGLRTASNNNLNGANNPSFANSGISYTDSTNYRTTSIDETRDRTRLPATDASSVRAPAQNFPVGNNRIAQLPRPGGPVYPPAYNVTASNTQTYNGQPVYQGIPVVSGNPYPGNPVYVGQPRVAPGYTASPVVGSPNTVVAQSSASYDPGSGSPYSWRNPEIGSGSDSFSR